DVAPNAVEAATASAAMSRAAATMRFLIENLQRASLDGLLRRDSPRWREERTCLRPSIGLYHSATARRLAHLAQGCQDHFATTSSPPRSPRTGFSFSCGESRAAGEHPLFRDVVLMWY